ncbi:MAG: phage virion morphogenesis protein, partial [Gammaproteobacteria bacterium]|nr:phage virion morphogenesis protein [Gammaproteobacteria bacterium]
MTRILIDVEGIETAGRRLGALARAGRDLRPVFVQIGEYLIRSTRDRFRDQKSPEGVPWAPLSEAYARRKHPNRQRILTRHGDLQSQLSYRAD